MSENMYDDEFETEQERTQEEENNKRRWVIPVSIAAIIALILALLFFLKGGDEDVEEPPVEETTSASVVPTDDPDTIAIDPSATTEPGVVTESVTPGPGDEDKEDTFFTGQAEPRYQEEPPTPLPTTGSEESLHGHVPPFDPAAGRPREASQFAVQNMFTIQPNKDGSYRDHFNNSMGDYISPQMKRTGFKSWWGADEPEHTPFYRTLAATPGNKIYNQIELKDERRTANDMVEYHYVVQPRIITDAGYTNVADFEIIVQMIGNEEGVWLMNDYYFPEGRVPPIH